jgi:hypothetical protein
MEVTLRSSQIDIQRSNSSSSLDGENQLGIKQRSGTASRLSSVSFTLNESGGDRGIKPLAYDGGDLRSAAGTSKSWGRFKNWLADKVPFVGKTTYGTILQKADAFSASAGKLSGPQKAGALQSLKTSIEAWQAKHPTASGGKAEGLANMARAVDLALNEVAAMHRLEQRLPGLLPMPDKLGDTVRANGPMPGDARDMVMHNLGGDVTCRDREGEVDLVQEKGKCTVSSAFWKDVVDRPGQMILKSGGEVEYARKDKGAGDPRDALVSFTGDPDHALALSHFIGQNVMASLEIGKYQLLVGRDEMPNHVLASGAGVSFSYEVERHELEGGEVFYTIDYVRQDPIPRLGTSPSDAVEFEPDSRLTSRMQLKVTQSQLEAGRGAFTIGEPPSFDLQLTPSVDRNLNPQDI